MQTSETVPRKGGHNRDRAKGQVNTGRRGGIEADESRRTIIKTCEGEGIDKIKKRDRSRSGVRVAPERVSQIKIAKEKERGWQLRKQLMKIGNKIGDTWGKV